METKSTKDQLSDLLLETTRTRKHSAYQALSTRLNEYIGKHNVPLGSKYEHERLEYITSKTDIRNKSALDIGSNTGFFVFELLDANCRDVTAYEGGKFHCKFLNLSAKALGDQKRITIYNEYFDFDNLTNRYDLALLLNVVHHIGDEFSGDVKSISVAKELMLEKINKMSQWVDTLIFQMGFNWKGDITKCLFANGTKSEMIDFVRAGVKEHWEVEHIGIPERNGKNKIRYSDLDDSNRERDDSLGEFLNRPLFIMRAKR